MSRHKFSKEESQRGGRIRAAQPSAKQAREKAFQVTMERHPFYARHHLKLKIKQQNKERSNVTSKTQVQ